MAVATSLLDVHTAVDTTTFNTDSISPSANALVLAVVYQRQASGTPATPTMSGNGLTWVQVRTYHPGAGNRRMTLFRAMGASPSAGAATVSFGGTVQSHATVHINQFTGVNTGGTNGSAAVVQSAENTGGSISSLTVTLAAFASANNATFGAFEIRTGATATAGSGFAITAQDNNGGQITSATEFRSTNDTGVDMSFSATNTIDGFAVEIAAAEGSSTSPSASVSPSASASASRSPSSSASSSFSASVSPSSSTSASTSPSASRSPSSSASASRSPSSSLSLSQPPFGAILKRWTGDQWVKAKLMAFLGTWQNKPMSYYDGNVWVDIDVSG